jgi:type IV fimbrial biogenesis protein FimT
LKAESGLSMIELLIVIVIASILLAIAVPSYRYITYSNRVSSEVNALLGDMQFARSEAVKEGQTVTVCPSADQATCAKSTSWQTGWIVFQDVGNNQKVAAQANVLRVKAPFTSTPQDTFVSDNTLNFVSFNREGFATAFPATAAGYVTFTLHTTPNVAQWTRCLQIFSTGMMGTERTTDAQGNCT